MTEFIENPSGLQAPAIWPDFPRLSVKDGERVRWTAERLSKKKTGLFYRDAAQGLLGYPRFL